LIYDVDSPFRCGECEAASVTIVNTRTFLREWLRRLCEELPAAHDDPQIGFQELDGLLEEETGGIIRDHGFRFAGDFEHLWSLAGRCFDQNAEVSSGGGFDTIWSRNDWRKTHWTPFIAHKNERTDTTISVIKDPRGHLWFDVERK